jgi:hypothetical protein
MSILSEINTLLLPLLPVETGVFSETAPQRYAVITPLIDTFELHSDDKPRQEIQEARISLFDKGSYTTVKNRIVRSLVAADFIITDRRYIVYESDTGYHHYAIDVAKNYELEE